MRRVGGVLAVLDVDGVVADVRHRLPALRDRDWARFFRAADADPLLRPGAVLAADLAAQHDIVWLTGRPEWLRTATTAWFDRHGLPAGELHMRPDGDHRPARLFKLGVLAGLAPRGVAAFVDDDPEVVAAVLAAGYPAVLADWVVRDDDLEVAQEVDGRT